MISMQTSTKTFISDGFFSHNCQIELRILAWLAKEPKLISTILQDRSTYKEFGETFYGRPIDKNTIEYVFAKAAVLGLGYNMGAKKFRVTAQQAFRKYREECAGKGMDVLGLFRPIFRRRKHGRR